MEPKSEYTQEQLQQLLDKFARRLRELRIEKGYSNYEIFAYDNNFSRTQYGRYEKGQDLRFTSLLRLLRALDISFEEFFKDFELEIEDSKTASKPKKDRYKLNPQLSESAESINTYKTKRSRK